MNGRLSRILIFAAPALLLGTAVLLFFQQMAFSNLILARGDTFLYFYPYWQAAADALRAGRVPLWNPALFMGAPFPGQQPGRILLPAQLAVVAAGCRRLTPTSASIIMHLMMAGTGTFLLGRAPPGVIAARGAAGGPCFRAWRVSQRPGGAYQPGAGPGLAAVVSVGDWRHCRARSGAAGCAAWQGWRSCLPCRCWPGTLRRLSLPAWPC